MKIEKKYIIAGALGVVSIALAVAYLQYKKFMNYEMGFKGIKVKELSRSVFNFDIFLKFKNLADVKIDIISQEYKVYVNDEFVSDLESKVKTTILPKAESVIPVNVKFDPNKVLAVLNKNYAEILINPSSVNIRVYMKLKVSFYGIKISMPYTYKETLKGLLAYMKS